MRTILFSSLAGLLFVLSCQAHADPRSVAEDLAKGLKGNAVIAIQPFEGSLANMSLSSLNALEDQFVNEFKRSTSNMNIRLVDRSKLDDIIAEQIEFQNIEEFSELLKNTEADILIVPSINRVDPQTIRFSARAITVKGANSGNVIVASKTYGMASDASFAVAIGAIQQNGKDRSAFKNSLVDGLTQNQGISIDQKMTESTDLIVDAEIELSIEIKETAASQEAKEGAAGLNMFNSIVGGMQSSSSGNNALSGMLGGVGDMQAQQEKDAEGLKERVFTVSITGEMTRNIDGSKIATTVTAEKRILASEGVDSQKLAAKSVVNEGLKSLGADLAAKVLGKPLTGKENKATPSSLLD